MTPISVSQTGTGRSNVVALSNFTNPFNVGLFAVVTGTVTFNIEISPDDPMDEGYSASGATWAVVPNFSALSASAIGALTIPARAISINVTAGTGSVTLKAAQAGLR